MLPSDTDRGIRWLSNFHPDDQATARLLLDAVEFVGQTELWDSLRELLSKLPETIETPITLVPVRELAETQAYFGPHRNAKPKILNAKSLPGSEGAIATLLNSLWRIDEQAGRFTAAPSLANMRASRTKSVVLVDDFSGSGDRISKFKFSFHRHGTLRAWKSLKLFKYHVATYAATRRAVERLQQRFGNECVHFHRIAPTFHSRPWSAAQMSSVEALCRRYRHGALLTDPLGHRRARALIAFAHTAPNNLPPVLWQTHGPAHDGQAWRPFFQGKAVPIDLEPLFRKGASGTIPPGGLAKVGSAEVWLSLEAHFPPPAWCRLLLVLLAIRRNARTEIRVAELTGLPLASVLEALSSARRSALVTASGLHLTDRGRSELGYASTLRLPSDEILLSGSDEAYYPRSLRVGR